MMSFRQVKMLFCPYTLFEDDDDGVVAGNGA